MKHYIIMAIPYLVQLACLIHIIRYKKDTFWIWIIIMVPYLGGVIYFFMEILPAIKISKKTIDIYEGLTNFIKPNVKLEKAKQKMLYASTYQNAIEYADALSFAEKYDEALDIYSGQKKTFYINDPELIFKIAFVLYKLGKNEEAMKEITNLKKDNEIAFEKNHWNKLYLLIFENLSDNDNIKKEYNKIREVKKDHSIDLLYLNYLKKIEDLIQLESIISNLEKEKQFLDENGIRYDRKFYRDAFKIGKALPGK